MYGSSFKFGVQFKFVVQLGKFANFEISEKINKR